MKSGRESGVLTRFKAPSPHPWLMFSSVKVPFLFREPASGERDRDSSGTVVDDSSLGSKKV